MAKGWERIPKQPCPECGKEMKWLDRHRLLAHGIVKDNVIMAEVIEEDGVIEAEVIE